ncbi:alcohol dehydrogenase catalytic domain-containing protein [Stieleria varia]|uniref:alcohol dehydrogenase catalytic domain-containing protein n=1 Tax=Stieleria varia TaxID=2528005 RepID=UPI0018D23C32|nr:alcohol dehydrogenase catalytic domain-containing protein [Stieleria varia]
MCFRSIQRVEVDELPDVSIQDPGDALVAVEMAGLCGSDLHPFFGRETGLDVGTVMGHEFVGRVIAVGGNVQQIRLGDRVCSPFTTNCGHCFYCQRGLTSRCTSGQLFGWVQDSVGLHGGQAELVRVPLADATLMNLPETISAEAGLLLGDNLSTAVFGVSMAVETDRIVDDVHVVVGCGTVGLLAIAWLNRLGAKQVHAVDPNLPRLSLAARLGATVHADERDAIEAIMRATGRRGADAVLEFVGLPDAQRLAYELIRPGGRMSVIGCHCTPGFSFSPADAYNKNLTYRTGRCPARHYMSMLAENLNRQAMDLDWCITHRFGLEDAESAYDVFAHQQDGCVKAVLTFG